MMSYTQPNFISGIQLFRERLSNKAVRDNAESFMSNGGSWPLIEALSVSAT